MTTILRYIELKTNQNDRGPAWIARVRCSRSGTTVYFNGKALKRSGGSMHFDLETGEEYWVSGMKKDGTDRHPHGSGRVSIEASVVPEYLALTGATELDRARLDVITDLPDTDPQRFHSLENAPLEEQKSARSAREGG